jgi:hypothetical protein
LLASLRQFYLERRLGPPIVVVSGLPRSGTSMMMRMLDAGGLDLVTDRVRAADEDNPRGYFELEQVKELDKPGDKSWLKNHRGKVIKIISLLLKDLPENHFYKVILMRRDLDEIIASQNKMLDRRGEAGKRGEDAKMIHAYRTHLRRVNSMLADRPVFDALNIEHRAVINHPLEQAKNVARFLRMNLDTTRMAQAVDPELYRNRSRS